MSITPTVATGTGSGKTECFLLPILDHCASLRADPAVTEKRGIKALIIYPMNALSTDQARRVAASSTPISPTSTSPRR